MWEEGIELAKTAYALDEALESGDTGRIVELSELLSRQVKKEVSSRAEAEGWYEEYNRATSAEHWNVETTVDPYGPAAFPMKVVPAEREAIPDRALQRLRREAGYRTAADFAEATGLPVGEYVRYERGQVDDIPPEAAGAIAKQLAGSGVQVPSWLSARTAHLNEHVDLATDNKPDSVVPTVSCEAYGERYTLALYSERYGYGGGLAVGALNISENAEDFGEEWGMLTVNLPNDPAAVSWCAQEGHVAIDTNNNPQALVDALVDAGIIHLSGRTAHSGFCTYPLATIMPEAMGNLRGFRETADRILAEHREADPQPPFEDRDASISLKGEASMMRQASAALSSGLSDKQPQRDAPARE